VDQHGKKSDAKVAMHQKQVTHLLDATVILTTTDLYEKLPANKKYILKEGRLHEANGWLQKPKQR